MDVKESIDLFLKGKDKNRGRKPDERYASFDYCYNYFYSFYRRNKLDELVNEKNLQTSCLQIGFYLASWGMMRGSSFLLEKSVKNYKNLISEILKMDPILWEIDADKYNKKNITLLLDCKKKIKQALGKKNNPTDTLITKIMLGVFANIPAYDKYVREKLDIYSFNINSLLKIKKFYENNKEILDSYKIATFDFSTSEKTNIFYTKAKLIDMYGFMRI